MLHEASFVAFGLACLAPDVDKRFSQRFESLNEEEVDQKASRQTAPWSGSRLHLTSGICSGKKERSKERNKTSGKKETEFLASAGGLPGPPGLGTSNIECMQHATCTVYSSHNIVGCAYDAFPIGSGMFQRTKKIYCKYFISDGCFRVDLWPSQDLQPRRRLNCESKSIFETFSAGALVVWDLDVASCFCKCLENMHRVITKFNCIWLTLALRTAFGLATCMSTGVVVRVH